MRYIIERDARGRRNHVLCWDDVSEQVRAVAAAGKAGKITHYTDPFCRASYWDDSSRADWLGRTDLRGWDDVVKAIENPWKEGMEAIEGMQDELKHVAFVAPKSIRRRPTWKDDDGDFDLDRYTAGQDSFRSPARRDVTGQQFVTLMVQVGANGGTRASSMMWRGAAAIVATTILEREGFGVEILAYDSGVDVLKANPVTSPSYSQGLVNAVWIKRTDTPLDVSALVNGISPWYFRILNFCAYGMVPGETASPWLGAEVKLDRAFIKHLTGDERYIVIEEVWNRKDAIKLANGILRRFADPLLVPDPDDDTIELPADAIAGL